ncbi:hypothetical protein ACE1SV_54270 [Streptomyces sp. E-15]
MQGEREAQAVAGRVDDRGDAVEVRVEQIGQTHQRILVRTWKPTSVSRDHVEYSAVHVLAFRRRSNKEEHTGRRGGTRRPAGAGA